MLGSSNGLDVMKQLRDAELFLPPIVFLTGSGALDIDIRAMEEGATEYLDKNALTPGLLERTIRYAIGKRQ